LKKKVALKDILLLQLAVGIYSINTVIGGFVGKSLNENGVMSVKTIGLLFFEVVVLGVYAILWQQLIGKFQLSIAYANKAMTLLWSLMWSIVLFHEDVTVYKIIGVIMVMAGTIILNTDPTASGEVKKEDKKEEER
jgi:drug/metabolite transporter (DMT)-like permease